MRKLFGVGKPRCLQGLGDLFCALICVRDGSRGAQNDWRTFSLATHSSLTVEIAGTLISIGAANRC